MIEPNAKIIALTCGEFCYVSETQYAKFSKNRWFAKFGNKNHPPYAARSHRVNNHVVTVWMHREIANAQPGELVDHDDGDTLNNCDSNLKKITKAANFKKRWSPANCL
jgi:hypothetical protein